MYLIIINIFGSFIRMKVAFETGITNHIFDEINAKEHFDLIKSEVYKEVKNIYESSKYYLSHGGQTREHKRVKNVLTLSYYLAVIGFIKATFFLLREIYLDACFGLKNH